MVRVEEIDGAPLAFPDTCVGTDSHTTMISGLGVLGFGVGGIEAEAVLLGDNVDLAPLGNTIPSMLYIYLVRLAPPGLPSKTTPVSRRPPPILGSAWSRVERRC